MFGRRRVFGELAEETRSHLEEKVEELVAGGMPREEAEFAARRMFGNLGLVERDGRAVWRWSMFENLLMNIRFGLRALRKNPGFTTVAVVTLALGIGATSAIYSVTYATLLAPLPYPNGDRLVMVWSQLQHRRVWGASAGDFLDWKRQSTVFQDLNAASSQSSNFNLATAGHPEYVRAQLVTPGYYNDDGAEFSDGAQFCRRGRNGWERARRFY